MELSVVLWTVPHFLFICPILAYHKKNMIRFRRNYTANQKRMKYPISSAVFKLEDVCFKNEGCGDPGVEQTTDFENRIQYSRHWVRRSCSPYKPNANTEAPIKSSAWYMLHSTSSILIIHSTGMAVTARTVLFSRSLIDFNFEFTLNWKWIEIWVVKFGAGGAEWCSYFAQNRIQNVTTALISTH